MINFLYTIYSAWPFRTHCRAGHHVILCRIFDPKFGPECDFPAPPK